MKRTYVLALASIVLSGTVAQAQTDPVPVPETTREMPAADTMQAPMNPTVEAIVSKYHTIEMPAPLTIEKIFPVIGSYQSNTDESVVKVAIDETNKGVAWIEGLPQGTVKAILLKSPATYKIPAQKTAEGNDVQEGTLIYSPESSTLQICLGKKYDFANPAGVFETTEEPVEADVAKNSKAKKTEKEKTWMFTGTKQELVTVAASPM